MMKVAVTGINGDNETNIQSSRSINFGIYNGDNGNEIKVRNLTSKPIDLWISKDSSVAIDPYEFINVLNITSAFNLNGNSSEKEYKLQNGFLLHGFKLPNPNSNSKVSIHIQIKPPKNKSLTYLTLLKSGDNPFFASNNYDSINLFCPQDLIIPNNGEESYYLIFENMSRVASFNKSYNGISILELNSSQSKISCHNKTKYLRDLNASSKSYLSLKYLKLNIFTR